MTNLVDVGAPYWRWGFKRIARGAFYKPHDAASDAPLLAFIRGVRSDDLFAAAMQQDVAGVVGAAEFVAALPGRARPARYDRLRLASGLSYTVEEWRGSPNDDAPVFYKLLLRGGSQ